MKNQISLFIIFVALLLPFTGVAYDFEADGIYYNIISGTTAEVTYKDNLHNSYNNSELIIPKNVVHNNRTYTITSIGIALSLIVELMIS